MGPNGSILVKFPNECRLRNYTVAEFCSLLCNTGPQPISVPNKTAALTVRYRNLSGSPQQQEIFLGKGDVGISGNRVAAQFNWDPNPTQLTGYFIVFEHNPIENKLFQLVSNLPTSLNPFANLGLTFPNLTISSPPPNTISVLPGPIDIDLTECDALEIIVRNSQGSQPNNIVTLRDLRLQTASGVIHSIFNDGSPIFSPANSNTLIRFYTWPQDGTTPAQYFKFTGLILLRGIFNSAEASRVEISVVRRDP